MRMRQDNYNSEKRKHGDIDWVSQKKKYKDNLFEYISLLKKGKVFWGGLSFCGSRNKAGCQIHFHVSSKTEVKLIHKTHFFYSV